MHMSSLNLRHSYLIFICFAKAETTFHQHYNLVIKIIKFDRNLIKMSYDKIYKQ